MKTDITPPTIIDQQHLRESKHHFRKGFLAELEANQIAVYIKEQGFNWARDNREGTVSEARIQLMNIVHKIAATFTNENRQTTLDANKGHHRIVSNPPNVLLVRGARVAALVVTFTELAIIAASIYFSGQTLVALVVGAILALASYVSGLGLGIILFSAFRRPERDLNVDPGDVAMMGWVRFLIPLGVAAAMAYFRSNNGRDPGALAFTVIFTVLIVTLTSISEFLRVRYDADFVTYYLGESELAAERHRMSALGTQRADVNPLKRINDTGLDYRWVAAFEEGIRLRRDHEKAAVGEPQESQATEGA